MSSNETKDGDTGEREVWNRVARIHDLADSLEEVAYLRSTGYNGEHDYIYYDYIYKWSRMLKCCKHFGLVGHGQTIVDVGGGLSPVQFMLANHGCHVINLDIDFEKTWFPTKGKYYIRATPQFIAESEKNASRIDYMRGSVFDEIKKIPSNSVDGVVETCAIHLFIGDGRNGLMDQISRILKPGGYFISIGDVANPHLGKCDHEFQYPKEMAQALSANAHLQLIQPFDYDTWEKELMDFTRIIPRRNMDYTDLSLINMKHDPKSIPYNNVPTYPIHLWTATYILQKAASL